MLLDPDQHLKELTSRLVLVVEKLKNPSISVHHKLQEWSQFVLMLVTLPHLFRHPVELFLLISELVTVMNRWLQECLEEDQNPMGWNQVLEQIRPSCSRFCQVYWDPDRSNHQDSNDSMELPQGNHYLRVCCSNNSGDLLHREKVRKAPQLLLVSRPSGWDC